MTYNFSGSSLSVVSDHSIDGIFPRFVLLDSSAAYKVRGGQYFEATFSVSLHAYSDLSAFSDATCHLYFSNTSSVIYSFPGSFVSASPATGTATISFKGRFDAKEDFPLLGIYLNIYTPKIPMSNYLLVFDTITFSSGVADPDQYYTGQIIDSIDNAAGIITDKIDESTGQITGKLDEIGSDIRGDNWTSPVPAEKENEWDQKVDDYNSAVDNALGGKSDEEIASEAAAQVDYDFDSLDSVAANGVSDFLTDLLEALGLDYLSLLMLSLTVGLCIYVLGRRIS